jgi:hypothetical protein
MKPSPLTFELVWVFSVVQHPVSSVCWFSASDCLPEARFYAPPACLKYHQNTSPSSMTSIKFWMCWRFNIGRQSWIWTGGRLSHQLPFSFQILAVLIYSETQLPALSIRLQNNPVVLALAGSIKNCRAGDTSAFRLERNISSHSAETISGYMNRWGKAFRGVETLISHRPSAKLKTQANSPIFGSEVTEINTT